MQLLVIFGIWQANELISCVNLLEYCLVLELLLENVIVSSSFEIAYFSFCFMFAKMDFDMR